MQGNIFGRISALLSGQVSPLALVRSAGQTAGARRTAATVQKPRLSRKARRAAAALLTAGALAGGFGVAAPEKAGAVVFYTLDGTNSALGTIRLNQTNLGNSVMANPSQLQAVETGGGVFNYVAALVRPTQDISSNTTYTFGMTSATFDSAMILYKGRFDPTRPGLNALVGNDDTPATTHQNIVGNIAINCGGVDRCPQVATVVTPEDVRRGQPYTLFISTYAPNTTVGLGMTFYSSGPAEFGSLNNLALIDTAKPYYRLFDLDFLVKPEFAGGTLRVDTNGSTYNQNFTLSGAATNTLDLYGNTTTFSGVISDAVAGTPGYLVLSNSNGARDGNLTLSGTNTFTGGLTIGSGVNLNVTRTENLGGSNAHLTFNGGQLNVTGSSITITKGMTVDSLGGTINSAANIFVFDAIQGNGALVKNGIGDMTLHGESTYSGTLTLNQGNLYVGIGIAGGSITNANIVNKTSVTFKHGGSSTSTYAGVISDIGSLTATGSSTLIITGNNTYTGGTFITDNAKLQLGDGGTTGSITGDVTGTTGGMLIFNRSDEVTFAGTINLTGSLSQQGSGVTTLTGSNTIGGNVFLQDGVLAIATAANLGSGNSLIFNGGTLRNTGAMGLARSVALNPTGGIFDTQAALAISSAISGNGALTKIGSDTLTLSGTNTYSGGTNINAGAISIGSASNIGTGAISFDSGALYTTNALSLAQAITLNAGGGTFRTQGALTVAGLIDGTGALTKDGSQALILTSDNTYTGGTTITAGTLQIGNGGTTGSILGNIANSGVLAFDRSNNLTHAGIISGTGSLVQRGTGTLILTGDNTYTGSTTISTGTLQIGNGGTTGSLLGNIANNGVLAFNRSDAVANPGTISGTGSLVQLGSGTLTLNGNNNYAGGTTISNGLIVATSGAALGTGSVLNNAGLELNYAGTTTFANSMSGSGTLAKTGAGTAILTGDNIHTGGTTITEGGLQVGNGGTTGSLSGNVANNGALTFNRSDSLTYAGVVSGTGTLTKQGAGTLTLTGNNTHTGRTNIMSGTLQIGNGGTTGSIAGDIANNGILAFNRSNFMTYAGSIIGYGSLVKTGAGDLTLSGDNSYTGGTTITTGTLIATSGTALGTGLVTNNAALTLAFGTDATLENTLSGTGSLAKFGSGVATLTGGGTAGTVSVSDGTLAFGQDGVFTASGYTTVTGGTTMLGGAARLNVTNAFTQAASSRLNVNVGSVSQPMITANTAVLNGTLNITGFSGAQAATASALTNSQVTILQTANGISGDFGSVNLGGASSTVDYLTLAGSKSTDNKSYNVGFGLTWLSNSNAHGTFTLTNAADTFNVDVALADKVGAGSWDGSSLTKKGNGTLILSAANTYSGATTVQAGTLQAGISNAFAQSNALAIASGATLDLNGFNQVAKNLSGAGTVELGSAALTAQNNSNTSFDGSINGSGSLVKTGTGVLTLTGNSAYTGGTTISAGSIVATSGAALGTGSVANNAALTLAFADNATFANALSGTGSLTKTGTGVATITGGGAAGTVSVNTGTLAFGQNGVFTAADYTTASGATTVLGGASRLDVTNTFAQASNATLNVNVGSVSQALITANTAVLNGALNITGFSGAQATTASALTNSQVTVVQTTNGISGDFTAVNLGGAGSTVDYVTLAGRKSADNKAYNVGFGLSWLAQADAHGTFTLTNAADTFNVDVALANQASSNNWDGHSLSKQGAGTLILSAANTYSGATAVQAGTLQAGISNAFAQSSALAVASGATLDLNGFNQVGNNLSGAGTVELGSAALTAQNTSNTTFNGSINGSGSLVKTGTGALTLTGNSAYTGGTTISAGSIVATSGAALGNGSVANNAALTLAFADNATFANALSGTGSLTKTGMGVATITGGGAAGTVSVNTGTLAFGQNGVFTAADYATASGATTVLGGASRLDVTNTFAQASNATLNVNVGSVSQALITASSASLNGTLNITGFSGAQAGTASSLVNSQVTLIETTDGILGNFNPINIDGSGSSVDYVKLTGFKTDNDTKYKIGFGLSWLASTDAHGTFTLGADTSFNVDMALSNHSASGGWDGISLTKAGAGTLVLSEDNTFTGNTAINGGTLQLGNGGATGSVAGDIVNNAALVFNRSDADTYFGAISGNGSVTQAGSGVLVLAGANSYTGATAVNSGTLRGGIANAFVNSGSMYVANGATLESGGFDQTVNNLSGQGTLSFGANALTAHNTTNTVFAGVMTGSGDLFKTGAAELQLTNDSDVLGNVDVKAGTLAINQAGSLDVSGDYVTRDGATTKVVGENSQLIVGGTFTQESNATLNVTIGATPDIIADSAVLDGTLVLSGFDTVGSAPAKASEVMGKTYTLIQTTNGITGNFASTPLQSTGLDYVLNDGSVSADGRNYNLGFKLAWTDGDAQTATGTFTLGAGTSFNVDIDLADRMMTRASGWNGTTLTKDGAGLLVLSGNNSYTGGTTINEGTLQVSTDANLGATSGGLSFTGGTLATTASFATARNIELVSGMGTFDVANDTTLTLQGDMTGAGGLIKTEIGKLVLEGNNTYSGRTVVDSGALIAGRAGTFSANSNYRVDMGGTLALQGYDQTVAGLDNAGNLRIGSTDGSRVGTTLTVAGTYVSNGGNLILNTVLGDDSSLTDKLVVDAVTFGNEGVSIVTGGNPAATKVYVTNVGGLGAKTTGDGIEIVHVNNAGQSAADAFVLGSRVAAGAYDYALQQGGTSNASDGNWYLRTTEVDAGYREETVVNVTVPKMVGQLGLAALGGVSGRDDDGVGSDSDSSAADNSNDPRCQDPVFMKANPQLCVLRAKDYSREMSNMSAWARVLGEKGQTNYGRSGDSVAKFEKHGGGYDYSLGGFIAGMDLYKETHADGSKDTAGVYVSASRMTSDVKSIGGVGKAGSTTVDGYTVGGYWRHDWASGFYVDAILQGTSIGAIETKSNAGQSMKTHGLAVLGSLEAGYKMKLGNGWTMEPQAQIVYQHGMIQKNSDAYGTVKFHNTDEYYLRVGLKAQKEWELDNGRKLQMFGRVNLWHGFGPAAKTTFAALDGTNPVTLGSQTSATWAQFTAGIGGQLSKNTSVFVSADYNRPIGANKGYSIGGRAGFRVTW